MASVLELLNHSNEAIQEYAQFLFDNDYSLYTAKQWGCSPKDIDPGVLNRVPLRFNYETGYFDDEFQVMPQVSYKSFFDNLLNHPNINILLNTDALKYIRLEMKEHEIYMEGRLWNKPLIYTGAIDELMDWKYGKLPYRSLFFEWKTENRKSFQDAPVVAYPQAEKYTRITEYTKLPVQEAAGRTTYAIEYPLAYQPNMDAEPYYPIPNKDNYELYEKYRSAIESVHNLYLCGRLAEYQYYNMDQALENALKLCEVLKINYAGEKGSGY